MLTGRQIAGAGAAIGLALGLFWPSTVSNVHRSALPVGSEAGGGFGIGRGLTLVHFSAQLEPCLTLKNNLHTPEHP
jgi:hypothetical protein